MNELRKDFLVQSITDLDKISQQIQAEGFSENFRLELFRKLHTIKGTAQTFGFSAPSQLAHTLENILVESKNDAVFDFDLKQILIEGIENLSQSLQDNNFQPSAEFASKIKSFQRQKKVAIDETDRLQEIPAHFLQILSEQEKSTLNNKLKNGEEFLVLEIGFEPANFAEDFKLFRTKISEKGEIIATFPSSKFGKLNRIGFQMLFTTRENIEELVKSEKAEIIFESDQIFSNNLGGVLAQVVRHGKDLAKKSGREIDFEIKKTDDFFNHKQLKLVFDILLHIVRNAVSHAVKKSGKIIIKADLDKTELKLSVADNGKGIDFQKIYAVAIEKHLISRDEIFDRKKLLDFIFLPDFSTLEIADEISGRGFGLNAVEKLVNSANGKISVISEPEKGTVFEIVLPR